MLVTGSVYGGRISPSGGRGPPGFRGPHRQERRRMNPEGPSVLTMIGAVALIVALVILVFFAAGYGFARLFL